MRGAPIAIVIILAITCLDGCSTLLEGMNQQILVSTDPSGSNCDIVREGKVIARVFQTPRNVTVKTTKYDLTVKCSKPGYQEGMYLDHPRAAGAPFGNIDLNAGHGWVMDLTDYQYGAVNMTLVPASGSQP